MCRLDLRYFPYDKQTCTFSFGSFTYWTDVIKLVPSVSLETTHYYNQRMNDFKITKLDANAHEWEEYQWEWASADYSVDLERISSAYSVKLVLPAVVTGFLVLLTFLLPPSSQEKITLAGLILLCHVLQLLYLQDLVPASGNTMLGDFLSFALCVDFCAILLAVLSYHVNNKNAGKDEDGNKDTSLPLPQCVSIKMFP